MDSLGNFHPSSRYDGDVTIRVDDDTISDARAPVTNGVTFSHDDDDDANRDVSTFVAVGSSNSVDQSPPAYISNNGVLTEDRLRLGPTQLQCMSEESSEDTDQNFQVSLDHELRPPLLRQLDSLQRLKKVGWYWGPLTWKQSEQVLKSHCDGSFLVRDSNHSMYFLTISFIAAGKVRHSRIEHSTGKFSFHNKPTNTDCYSSNIIKFIEQNVKNSREERYSFYLRSNDGHNYEPVYLLYPVSRLHSAFSLRHLSRFQIRCTLRIDKISGLDMSNHLKDYCRCAQIFTEQTFE